MAAMRMQSNPSIWELTEINYHKVEEVMKDLYIRALKDLPEDVRIALKEAYRREESPIGKKILETMLQSVEVADDKSLLVCQDTGIPVFFITVGNNVRFDGVRLEEAIKKGTKRATREHPFRSSICSCITRINDQSSTGSNIPVIHYEFIPGTHLEILCLPKGSGSENMSFLNMLIPEEGINGIKRFVLESVFQAGANPCPPCIVGVGIGGSSDLCMKLAKKATSRPIGSSHSDPLIAKLEKELLDSMNRLGIGPNGLGGNTTALAVHVEAADTHITMNPVGVNMMCWAARRAKAVFYSDGSHSVMT
ncbi:fumarate hydratase [Microaerobacter geothermalis]|uniref:fumarate hydratase n=1 Tax=Microaerobacter geothermalis TaxID=674972 RepID=UPI001F41788C|nr:fumarate hydratase [Microaerobacter geothermalis]MCF6092851.1 fumarate hydratase [Microaerobacter geothermalis]